jgi:hypothetical protein
MTYLDTARAVVYETRETRKIRTDGGIAATLGDEINEKNEKSPDSRLLTQEEVEELKAQIVAAAAVEPAEFDHSKFDRLWARWKAHEAAGAGRAA